MFVFSVFLSSALVMFAIAVLRRRSLRSAVPTALRGGLAVLFTMTGVTHFVALRDDLIAMVPPGLPAPELLVTCTGLLELAGAAGLLIRPIAAWAAAGLGLLLVGVFPANVYAAYADVTLAGAAATPILPRTGMQLVYLAAAIVVFVTLRHHALRWSEIRDGLRTLTMADSDIGLPAKQVAGGAQERSGVPPHAERHW